MPVQDTEETTGQRVARLRKLRGFTQHGLASRSHVSRSLIAKVESGHSLATPAFIAAVSTALSVDPTEVFGQPYRGDTPARDRVHATIPEVRRALDVVDVPPELGVEPRPVSLLAREVEALRSASKDAKHLQVGTRLPAVLSELAVHAHTSGDPRVWRHVNAAQALAVSLSRRLGYTDLATSAIKDAAASAARGDDPNLPALAQLSRALMMMMYGSWVAGLHLVRTAASAVDQDSPQALAVHGALQLRSAVLSARGTSTGSTTEGDAWEHFGQAEETARKLPKRAQDWYALQFNPANVQIHGCAVAVEMGDYDEALRRDTLISERTLATLPAERRAHHDIDMARALVEVGKHEKALGRLVTAERSAPQMTRYHPSARSVAGHLVDVHRSIPEPLRGLARRMRIS
ncbi:helix-turn-helix transcriptional regulator [Nocardiopsis sp. N85]|uniref:helix-turn-helix domain-containing protein n=1 Tax=Nocardiopsis sp. N85 TaxID=3029400 RepID=UPI00237FD37C|nr:helix-turn-helix transcriptional regulator [Nocardiopsis sp. N85]MDE3725215.1 helix-turn-helix transcriptional regulator [Nocardiopsis sp. N85]